MTGIHYVLSLDKDDNKDEISLKKILKYEGDWAIKKNVLRFDFDGNPGEHTIWLIENRRTDILTRFKKWIREAEHIKKGIPFEEFRNYLEKLRNAFISILAGKGMLSPCNQVLGKDP